MDEVSYIHIVEYMCMAIESQWHTAKKINCEIMVYETDIFKKQKNKRNF